jgi:hypothetical protein
MAKPSHRQRQVAMHGFDCCIYIYNGSHWIVALGHFFLVGNWQIAVCLFSLSVVLSELLGLAVVPRDFVSSGP